MLDSWGFNEWAIFVLCCLLSLTWLLYAYAMWQSAQSLTDFDKEHDREED